MRRLILPSLLGIALAATLTACGQKGPLFYPPAPAAGTAAHPQATAQPASSGTAMTPAPTSTTRSPFNPILHQ